LRRQYSDADEYDDSVDDSVDVMTRMRMVMVDFVV